jgi:acyl-CoA thioesterase-1
MPKSFFHIFAIMTVFSLSACSSPWENSESGKNANGGTDAAGQLWVTQQETSTGIILAIGDSLTAGYGLQREQAYPALLAEKLASEGYRYEVVDSGISGETSAQLLARLDWVLEGISPSVVIVEIGANDAFRGIEPETVEANLRWILTKLKAKNLPVLLTGMKTFLNAGPEYKRQFESIYPKLAEEYDLAFMEFFLAGVALKPEFNQSDRIHPNEDGYRIVAENVFKKLVEYDLITKRPDDLGTNP